MDPRPHRTVRRAGAAGSLAALLCATACSGSGTPAGSGASSTPSGAVVVQEGAAGEAPADAGEALALRSRVTRVAGHLSDTDRRRVGEQARAVVAAYLEGAFATGDRPFRGFLPGLRHAARADAPVLRGEVGPTRARAWFSVAAPHGRPIGITALLRVERPAGDAAAPAPTLTGRVVLTRVRGQWRVLGYDLARGRR